VCPNCEPTAAAWQRTARKGAHAGEPGRDLRGFDFGGDRTAGAGGVRAGSGQGDYAVHADFVDERVRVAAEYRANPDADFGRLFVVWDPGRPGSIRRCPLRHLHAPQCARTCLQLHSDTRGKPRWQPLDRNGQRFEPLSGGNIVGPERCVHHTDYAGWTGWQQHYSPPRRRRRRPVGWYGQGTGSNLRRPYPELDDPGRASRPVDLRHRDGCGRNALGGNGEGTLPI
jgi:hypothetical protein